MIYNLITVSKIETWITAGYEILGAEGAEGVKIERIARALQLNKSGFYYYFGSMDEFMNVLVRHHVQSSHIVSAEIMDCECVDPDLIGLILKHKVFFLAESRLQLKNSRAPYHDDVEEVERIVNTALVSLWKKLHHSTMGNAVALAYLHMVRHFFYARIDVHEMTQPCLRNLISEVGTLLETVSNDRHIS